MGRESRRQRKFRDLHRVRKKYRPRFARAAESKRSQRRLINRAAFCIVVQLYIAENPFCDTALERLFTRDTSLARVKSLLAANDKKSFT